jgi:hypothetical protein
MSSVSIEWRGAESPARRWKWGKCSMLPEASEEAGRWLTQAQDDIMTATRLRDMAGLPVRFA